MNKKLLLRRPRYLGGDAKIYESKPEASFKEEIQSEIEALDLQHYNSFYNNPNEDEEMIEVKFLSNKIVSHSGQNECSMVSVCNINEGLKPMKVDNLIQKGEKSNKIKLSNKTYKQFEHLETISQCEKPVFKQNIFEQIEKEIPIPNQSVPKHIIIIQIAALLKYQLSNNSDREGRCVIKNLSKPSKFPVNWNNRGKYEIILFENENNTNLKSMTPYNIADILQQDLINLNVGENRQPELDDEVAKEITPTKVSMMECLMTGKKTLNFNAHSISKLPKLLHIFEFLNELNLSYNYFKMLPDELYQLRYLRSLNLRNNPLQILDNSISNLASLQILICSFTLITNIPSSLFECENLEQADLSYNNICHIPHINGTSKLKHLNLSGNPIRYFKKSFIKLNLESLGLENTLTHPIFWKEGDFAVNDCENSWGFCDICDQLTNELSINLMAFGRKFYHVIPILMSFCSTLCRDAF